MQENLIKVVVYPKTRQAKTGAKFVAYSTSMNLIDREKGSETEGQVITKSVSVKFTDNCTNKNLILKTPMLLTIKEEDINAPSSWYVKEETNDKGEIVKKYPCVWIEGIVSSVKYKNPVNQNQFAVKIDDEIENEEIEINNDNSPF